MYESAVILAQLDESLKAIRDQFRHGGSFAGVLLTALVIAGVLLLAYVLTRRQQRRARPGQKADPEGLFFAVLEKLPLTPAQRRMLTSFAADLHMEHPTVMLLSPRALHRSATNWRARQRTHEGDDRALDQFLHDVELILFSSDADGAGEFARPASGASGESNPEPSRGVTSV